MVAGNEAGPRCQGDRQENVTRSRSRETSVPNSHEFGYGRSLFAGRPKENPAMTESLEAQTTTVPVETDLLAALQRVLQASAEPLTVAKIRQQLPTALRSAAIEE